MFLQHRNTEVVIPSHAKTDVFVWELCFMGKCRKQSVKSIFDLFYQFLTMSQLHMWSACLGLCASHSLWHEFLSFFTVNPCCYLPCQHWGVCVRYGEDKYECDCTRTGYYGENCTVRESTYPHETSAHILPYYCTLEEFEVFCCSFVHETERLRWWADEKDCFILLLLNQEIEQHSSWLT